MKDNGLTEVEKELLMSMYNKGEKIRVIADELGLEIECVNYWIAKLVKSGKMIRRSDLSLTYEERIQKTKEMYLAGKTVKEIAAELGLYHKTVSDYITDMSRKGELPPRPRGKHKKEVIPVEVDFPDYVPPIQPGAPTLPEGQTVNCCPEISKTCVYGEIRNHSELGCCRYILVTHDNRGCSGRVCNKYSKITKENPRRF